jgi:GT2 family glycosyltransferase
MSRERRVLPWIDIVFAQKAGLTIQRNRALEHVPPEIELVVFIDDDVELAPDYLERAREYFTSHPDVVAMCGDSIDGASAVSRDEARVLLDPAAKAPPRDRPSRGLYGCNMNIRSEAARKVRFDERLMFYAFMEDHDFGARCEAYGKVMQYFSCRLVHFRESSGRISKAMLGYGQMMNPYYLWRKGSIRPSEFIARSPRYLLANLRGLLLGRGNRNERWQALRGNFRALKEIAMYGAVPKRIVRM